MSESSEITGPLIKALNQTGGLALRMNSGTINIGKRYIQLHEEGTADILFFPRLTCNERSKTPVWIETKYGNARTKKSRIAKQAEFRATVEALGHRYILAKTIDEGLEALA
jgi:hypothetical protein